MMANEVNLDFEWDVHKASSNAAKHGVTFEQAATVWQDAFALTVFDAVHGTLKTVGIHWVLQARATC